jgi:hypothetical protein
MSRAMTSSSGKRNSGKSSKRTKYLLPIGPCERPVTIHREAREAAERAIHALRDLHAEDPWVLAAVVDLAWREWRQNKPPAARIAIRQVRADTHAKKVQSMKACIRRAQAIEAEDADAKEAPEAAAGGKRASRTCWP